MSERTISLQSAGLVTALEASLMILVGVANNPKGKLEEAHQFWVHSRNALFDRIKELEQSATEAARTEDQE